MAMNVVPLSMIAVHPSAPPHSFISCNLRRRAITSATRALALLIEQVSSSNVICGFLEQSPYAVDLASQAQASGTKMHVMGLFLEAGLHGGEDFESITRAAGDACCGASIIGDHYGLADLLETEIKRSLEHWASVD